MANSFPAPIPVSLAIGPKRKLPHVKRAANLREIWDVLKDIVHDKPETWNLEHNKKFLKRWTDAVNFFDQQNCNHLELEVESGPLPVNNGSSNKWVKHPTNIWISDGRTIKARQLLKTLSICELHSVVKGIFPEVIGKEYHLEYSNGVFLDNEHDWKWMQEHLKWFSSPNRHIDLKLVINWQKYLYPEEEKRRRGTVLEVAKKQSVAKSKGSFKKDDTIKREASNFVPNFTFKSMPVAIDNGNYRGALQECLMKYPQTRGYKLKFDTKHDNTKNGYLLTRGTLDVEKLFSIVAFGTGPSKKRAIQDCAKQFLEKLGIIPTSEIDCSKRPNEKAHRQMSMQSDKEDVNKQLENFSSNDSDFRTHAKYDNSERVKREALWNQIMRILVCTNIETDAVTILESFSSARENPPSLSELNSVLFEKAEEGLLHVKYNKGGRPGWSIPVKTSRLSLNGKT